MQSSCHFFASSRTNLDEGYARTLAAAGRQRLYPKGATISDQGDESGGFWLIASGKVTVCRFDEAGAVIVYGVLGAGDLIGELAYFAGIERQVAAIAESDAEMVWIDHALCQRLLAADPGFARYLLGSLANQLRQALDLIEADRLQPAEQRLIRAIGDKYHREGSPITCTQQELADLIGVSRVTVGHLLGSLSARGLIERGYGQIRINDPQALFKSTANGSQRAR